jgi:hypothetical protein
MGQDMLERGLIFRSKRDSNEAAIFWYGRSRGRRESAFDPSLERSISVRVLCRAVEFACMPLPAFPNARSMDGVYQFDRPVSSPSQDSAQPVVCSMGMIR